jgi:hypothetical protein
MSEFIEDGRLQQKTKTASEALAEWWMGKDGRRENRR